MSISSSIAVFVSLLLACSSSELTSLRDLGVKDWAELRKKVAPAVPRALKNGKSAYDYILDSPTATTIHQQGTRSLWLSMCQSGEPFVSLLGYRCIVEKSPTDSFDAALATLASCGISAIHLEPRKQLDEAKPTDDNKRTFTRFVNNPKNGKLALDDVTAFLNESFLYDWAVSTDLSSVPAKVQYIAVGQVYFEANEEDSEIPESVAVVFNSFEKQSGNRLATFVRHAPASVGTARLRSAIERLLQDDTVPVVMFHIALDQRVGFIRCHVDASKLQLTPAQKERFERFLERAEKREGT